MTILNKKMLFIHSFHGNSQLTLTLKKISKYDNNETQSKGYAKHIFLYDFKTHYLK